MLAGDEIPDLSSGLSSSDKQSFELKRLEISVFRGSVTQNRKKAWEEVKSFLTSIREILFSHEELPEDYLQRGLFAPQLAYPIRPAGLMYLGLDAEARPGSRDQFLFIEDVFHLSYEVWKILLEEEQKLNAKYQIALKNSNQAGSDTKANWEKRLADIATLRDSLRNEIRVLEFQFEPYSFSDGTERITQKISHLLLERRKEFARGSEFKTALDILIGFVEKIAVEAGLDIGELPDGESAEATDEDPGEDPSETKPDETEPDAGASFKTKEEAKPDSGGGESDSYTTPLTGKPEEEPDKPPTVQDVELNNLKTITIETERLSRIFLYQLAAQYGIPPELLQDDNSGFRDTIREDMRQWIVKKLQAGELDALYDPNAIRERQLLVARFGEVLSRDGRFDLFQKILLQHHQRLNTDPVQQAAFREELANGSFQDPESWRSLLKNFANGMLDTSSDPQNQTAVNPKEHIARAVKSSLSSLAASIDTLGIGDLNLADNPQLFNERLTNIVNRIDVMVALRFAPIYLETLGREHFKDTFNIDVSESEYRSLVFILQTYWDVRERSFAEKGVNLNYVLEGLDVDELEDWIRYMPSMSKEEYYNRYLERIDYFAEIGLRVNGFHRVVLALAPLSKKTKATGGTADGEPDDDGGEPDLEELKKQNAVNKIKLEVMRDSLAYAFSELPDDAKRAVYNQIDPSQTDEWLKTGYFPVEISFNDLDLIAQYANELGITSPVADDAITGAGGWQNDPNISPMPGAARRAGNSIRGAKNRFQQFSKMMAKRRKKIAKQAAKKAAQKTTKATAEVALNALGSALGLPGLGTVLVNLWYSIPEQFRPVLVFVLVTGPLALLGGLAAWLFGLPGWLSSAGANLSSFFKGLFNPKTTSAVTPSAASAFQSGSAASAAAAQGTAQASLGASTAKIVMGIHPAAQAILISTGVVGVSSLLNYMIITNAFLANFPLPDEDKSINEKISKYVALEKTVTVPPPCDQATLKCPELSGGDSYEVTYTIKLTLKGDYTVSINKIKDEITAKFSKKKFEELGKPLPANIVITKVVIPNTETGSRSDFEELTTDPNDERNIIRPGEELILTYVETYDSKFNNSLVRNIFRADFFYVDGDQSGNDFVETAKSVCIGDCSQEEGCWPATGEVTQEPWGSYSHSVVDAYDIADPHADTDALKKLGVPMERMSNPAKIYSPFEAQACYPPASAVYGNYVVLTTKDWVYWMGHMISRAQESGCQQVQPGDIVGVMGTTGKSSGVHLHWELRTIDGSTAVGKPADPLGDQMPPSLTNKMNPKDGDYIGSCYDMD